jgi:hypothetical protein
MGRQGKTASRHGKQSVPAVRLAARAKSQRVVRLYVNYKVHEYGVPCIQAVAELGDCPVALSGQIMSLCLT